MLGDPLATRLVVVSLPTPGAGEFDPDPTVTSRSPVRLIVIDRPGYGASDPLPDPEIPTVERFADDVAEYLHAIRREASELSGLELGPAAAIGWSFGATVTTALAARHPDLVDQIVLVAAPRPKRLHSGERFSVIAELRKHGVERSFASLKDSLDEGGRPTLLALGVDDGDPALAPLGVRGRLDRMLESAWSRESAGMATDRLAVRSQTWVELVGKLAPETLLVYGDRDGVASARDAIWFERHISDARRITVPGAGHLVVIDAWADILQWVDSKERPVQQGEADPQLRR